MTSIFAGYAAGGQKHGYTAKAVAIAAPKNVQNILTSGAPTTGKFLLTMWFRLPPDQPTWLQFSPSFWFMQNVSPSIGAGANNIFGVINANLDNTAGTLQATIQGGGSGSINVHGVADAIGLGTWYCYMLSCDTNHADGAKQLQQFLGDTNQSISVTDGQSAFQIDFDAVQIGTQDFALLATSFGTPGIEVSDMQIWFDIAPDLSVESNRRKIIDASGKPVNPAVAATAFGTQTVLLSGNASGFTTNQGLSSGGTFAVYTGLQGIGRNGAGSVAVTGALSGSPVQAVVSDRDFSYLTSDFESTITVSDHIQQTSSDDLSGVPIDVALRQGTLTNASTSPSD